MTPFLSFLTSLTPLSPSAIRDIENIVQKASFSKKQILIPNLATCEHLYFIEKGLARAYFFHEGKEITDWFGLENMIIGPIVRRFPIKDTQHRVELLEDTEVVSVSFAELEQLYQKHHDVERLGRIIAIQALLLMQKKVDSIQLLSAKQRYEQFLEDYPSLHQRASLTHIASYLGMNLVTLSKIRRKDWLFSLG